MRENDPRALTFEELLVQVLEDPAAEHEIERRYRATRAVLVVDFSGMVARTAADGIVYALALPREAERHMAGALEAHHGVVVKRVADTFFAVFEAPRPALEAALEARAALEAFNAGRLGCLGDGTRTEPIGATFGLGVGSLLLIPGHDLYGDEVNRAFVLGEDHGEPGEILVTEAFARAVGDACPLEAVAPTRCAHAGFAFHRVAR